jgi:hypothetical protein
MAKTTKKLTATEHAVEVLSKILLRNDDLWDEVREKILRNFKRGMQSKAARAKDRKYTSSEKHEKNYAKKRKSPIVKYKK